MDASKSEQDWKQKALEILKTYYLQFDGCQWHEFDRRTDTPLLQAKICYALFGPPSDDAETVESAYNVEQRKKACEIMKVLLTVHEESKQKCFHVGFIFIYCKQDKAEFVLPIFSVYVGVDSCGVDVRKFVDTQLRIYKNWDDWKENNRLPKLQYAYPKRGFFTCSGSYDYEFDPNRDPDVEFGTSPQSSASSGFFQKVDNVAAIASLGAGVVGIFALFTPLAPVVLTAAAVAGTTSAGYGACRVVNRLVDKGQHGESLADFESLTLWLTLAATPMHFITSAVNGTLALGAQQGRIFSANMRMFATVLNFTTLGLDGLTLGVGLANLINKAVHKELTTLDVLQFSMSAFFFTNTLMQPKVASNIIRQAQEQHFDRHMNAMTDSNAKESFQNFLERNKAQGTITERSKIVRTINRMEDPNTFFKGVGTEAQVTIGGRKGKTALIKDLHGKTKRMNPNKMKFPDQTPRGVVPSTMAMEKVKESYDKEIDDILLNGQTSCENVTEQKEMAVEVLGAYDANIVDTAFKVAKAMGCNSIDDLINVVKIVALFVKGKSAEERSKLLDGIAGSETGILKFVKKLLKDMAIAERYAEGANISTENQLLNVYNYRKHGQHFPNAVKDLRERIEEVYQQKLDDIKLNGEEVFQNMNDVQRLRAETAFGDTCVAETVRAAHNVAESIGLSTAEDLMTIVEIVAAAVRGMGDNTRNEELNRIVGFEREAFIADIFQDMDASVEYAKGFDLSFPNSLFAVYHYRKHGADFPQVIQQFGDRIDFYLGPAKDPLFQDSNLIQVITLPNNAVERIYTTCNDQFGVTFSTPDGTDISTIFTKPACYEEFIQHLVDQLRIAPGSLPTVNDAATNLARFLGFKALNVNIKVDDKCIPFDEYGSVDASLHEHIAKVLVALAY